MKRLLAVLAICFATFAHNAKAQDYTVALGIKGGYMGPALNVKWMFSGSNALEGTLWGSGYSAGLGLFYEWNKDLAAAGPGAFNWYLGGGGHVGYWHHYHPRWDRYGTSRGYLTGNFILGIEYCFDFGLDFALDWQPGVQILPGIGFDFWSGGFAIRYGFGM